MRGKKLAIAIVSGTGRTALAWLEVAGILRECGHDVYVVTASNFEERGRLAVNADLLAQIRDSIDIRNWNGLVESDIVLIGQSLDGTVLIKQMEVAPVCAFGSTAIARTELGGERQYRAEQVNPSVVGEALANGLLAPIHEVEIDNRHSKQLGELSPDYRAMWRRLPANHNLLVFPEETAALIIKAADGWTQDAVYEAIEKVDQIAHENDR